MSVSDSPLESSSFTSWSKSTEAVVGEYDYYTKQYYENGAHCWNGPQRSVTVWQKLRVLRMTDDVPFDAIAQIVVRNRERITHRQRAGEMRISHYGQDARFVLAARDGNRWGYPQGRVVGRWDRVCQVFRSHWNKIRATHHYGHL